MVDIISFGFMVINRLKQLSFDDHETTKMNTFDEHMNSYPLVMSRVRHWSHGPVETWWVFSMVIFHSYVRLPEGSRHFLMNVNGVFGANRLITHEWNLYRPWKLDLACCSTFEPYLPSIRMATDQPNSHFSARHLRYSMKPYETNLLHKGLL